MKPPRRLTWVLGAGFALLCLWWAAYVPYRPERLLLPIPARADLVTRHRDLGDRLDRVVRHPIIEGLLQSIHDGLPDTLTRDPDVRDAIVRFFGKDVVVAHVPGAALDEDDMWVFVSWIGGWSHWLPWFILHADADRFERHAWAGGRMSWTLPAGTLGLSDDDMGITFAVDEGIVFGCVSRTREPMQDLFACYDGAVASVRGTQGGRASDWLNRDDVDDRGWFKRGHGRRAEAPVLVRVEDLDDGGMELRLRVSDSGLEAPLASVSEDVGIAPELAGDLASAVFRLRSGPETVPSLGVPIRGLILLLVGGEYGGRLHGLRIPAVVGMIPTGGESAALAWVRAALDHLNVRFDLGLYSVPSSDRDRVYAVRSTAETVYSALPEDEQVAWTVEGDWLVFSTSRLTLESLLQRRSWAMGTRHAAGLSDPWRWLADDPHVAAGWIDVPRAGKAVRNVLAVVQLQALQTSDRTLGAKLQRVRSGLNLLDGFGQARLWVEPAESEIDLCLRITP